MKVARETDNMRAGWMRVMVAAFGLAILPFAMPGLWRHRWVLIAYLCCALLTQLLIYKNIGGELRALLMGLVDVATLTFLVHRVGSVSSMLVSLYVLIGMMNALVVSRRVATVLAVAGALAYTALLVAEATGVLPYAPDGGALAGNRPSARSIAVAIAMVSVLMLVSTAVVSRLAHELELRETELLDANARLEELSQRDPLTQLYNRRYLIERLLDELAHTRRGRKLALLMVDLDQFKRVNDENGQVTGDALLQEVAAELSRATRANDVAGRYGGDEFVVILSDADRDQATTVANRLVGALADAGRDHHVTASVGVAIARKNDDVTSLVKRADYLAYRAKQAGGNRALVDG